MATETYDFISLGSGEAGKYLAWTLSAAHCRKCAVIEREFIGGSCPNTACLPSKSFIHSAAVAHEARAAASYGFESALATTDFKAKISAVTARKRAMVDGLIAMHLGKFKDTHVELIMGEGVFTGPKTLKVGDRTLTAETIVICTGSRARVDPSVPGLVEAKPLTHKSILNMQNLPSHLIILGGGYVGLEFAQAFSRFGARVTVVDRNPQVLAREDPDVVAALVSVLEREGVRFLTGHPVDKVTGECGSVAGVQVHVAGETVEGTHLLAAAGRVPNTDTLGLELAGIPLAPQGTIQVDDQLRTAVDGVFAVGDCAGSPNFTHMGFDDFRVVYGVVTGAPRAGGTAGRQVPSVLFTAPELAQVGLREREAQEQGVKYRLTKLPMAAFLRTRTLGEGATEGFAKALVEAEGDKILGFTALGPAAGEMLPVVQLAMKLGVSYTEVASLILVHPTMNESVAALFAAVPPRS